MRAYGISKDVFQASDFLESRAEIDKARLAFYGTGFGAYIGQRALALEPRLKAGVLIGGSLFGGPASGELDPLNFAPRIEVPVFINGRNDFQAPFEARRKPLFRFLGSRESDKRHAVSMAGTFRRCKAIMRESLAWPDKYLGPVVPTHTR